MSSYYPDFEKTAGRFKKLKDYLKPLQTIWKLSEVEKSTPIDDVLTRLESLITQFESDKFNLSGKRLKTLQDIHRELCIAPLDGHLGPKMAETVGSFMAELTEEFSNQLFFCPHDRVRFNAKKWIDDPEESLFEDDCEIFKYLDEISKYDLMESAWCIVMNRSTAAAFHTTRAIEAVLRIYGNALVKTEPKAMWGTILKELENEEARCPGRIPLNLIKTLRDIKNNYRNPIAHPEEICELSRANTLNELCVNAIRLMIKDLNTDGE